MIKASPSLTNFAAEESLPARKTYRVKRKAAKMLEAHLESILTYLRHPITNAVTEGLNSNIQAIKPNARGFRSFLNYRTRILFFCGKLSLGLDDEKRCSSGA